MYGEDRWKMTFDGMTDDWYVRALLKFSWESIGVESLQRRRAVSICVSLSARSVFQRQSRSWNSKIKIDSHSLNTAENLCRRNLLLRTVTVRATINVDTVMLLKIRSGRRCAVHDMALSHKSWFWYYAFFRYKLFHSTQGVVYWLIFYNWKSWKRFFNFKGHRLSLIHVG